MEKMVTESDQEIITLVSFIISIIGILANTMSLLYYVKKANTGLGNRLLQLLNTIDIVVNVSYSVFAVQFYLNIHKMAGCSLIGAMITWSIYVIACDCAGFTTCLISLTRTVKVLRPFHNIKEKWVILAFVIYFIYTATRKASYIYLITMKIEPFAITIQDVYFIVFVIGMTLYVTAVFISTVITAQWLQKKIKVQGNTSNQADNSKHITTTILILSTVFFLINVFFISLLGNLSPGAGWGMEIWTLVVINVGVCLNSTINPMVYLVRNKGMRDFLVEIWVSVSSSMTSSREISTREDMAMSIRGEPTAQPTVLSDISTASEAPAGENSITSD